MTTRARRLRFLLHGALALACWAAAPAWGQLGISPGRVLDTIPDRKPVLPATPPEVIFEAPRPEARHDPGAPRFSVNAFAFSGNTVFSERLLKRLVERFVDLQLNLFDLTQAADVVTRYYRDQGYPIARAIVPAQKVEAGVVRIEVVEGRIGRINVAGNERYPESFIAARAANLPKTELVTLEGLERSLLLLNDLPGLSARATLQPGGEFGTTDVLIRAEEKRARGAITFDNAGRRETGEYRIDGSFDLLNPLAIGDQVSFRLIETQHDLLRYARIGYSLPLGADGMRAGGTYSRVDYEIAGPFAILGIEGDVTNYELTWSYPFLRSRARNVVFGLGLRRTETSQRTLGVETTNTSIDLAGAALNTSWVHSDSALTNANVLVSGNGKRNPFGTRQDAQYAKLDVEVNHLRAASRTWDLFLRGQMVLSRDALADTEKFSIGGPDSVRGYRPADLRADRGWLGTVELRRQFQVINTVGVFNVFYDAAQVKAVGFGGTDSIRSAGAGLTVFPHKNLRAKLEYAHALSDRPSGDGKEDRFWVSIIGSF